MRPTLRHWIGSAALALCLPSAGLAGPDAMTVAEARHLLSRTGFGAAPHEIEALVGQPWETAVEALMDGIGTRPSAPMPAWVEGWGLPYAQIEALGPTAEELFYANRWIEITELQHWWLGEMIATPSPLTERLVLFWHDHFATSFEAHENPQWMAAQNRLFRTHAAGNFADLADGILRDPAMLVYLTNTENHRDAPNENFAREYFELFTLGEGRGYGEGDVSEAARALTGHTIDDFGAPAYAFDAEAHDFRRKTILGRTGMFDAPDLATLAMEHPDFGPHVVEALWRTFVSDTPDREEVERLVGLWRGANWELRPLLRALFLSDAFWAPEVRGRLVKSPVELLVGSIRSLGLTVPNLSDLAWAIDDLGQPLFFPPNVGGWPEGADWINDASVSARATVLTELLELEPDDEVRDRRPMPRIIGATEREPERVGPDDLRIGQAFALEAERLEEGGAAILLTLFDVGFDGADWRSLSIWLEVWPEDDFVLGLHIADCAPDCFADWPHTADEDPGWILFEPRDGLRRDLATLSETDRSLLAAVLGHLPDILSGTRDQPVWSGRFAEDREDVHPIDLKTATEAAGWIAGLAAQAIGPAPGRLVDAASDPQALGLNGPVPQAMRADEIDGYIEAREAALRSAGLPAVRYTSFDKWLRAVPLQGLDSKRAEAALLAVPLGSQGRRDELAASDPEALIRHIILSPHYQVN
ncbi:MAG: DUF1800 domain-containing protein [Rhodobacter sp.]|nr:DUF1800 domain-containing protein [Rhodobacter sp.]